ncbi:uncharacterized protein M421DRAFT_67093 [Didymella exigua CBS 183.55]|uniref:Uncharacterized protein n=1 Tax=Didymella exigua CBS 183.55 TaxID=1150837 RepID=A0A6A5RJR7_9PLEO|nr:uncharacterized protein M421DRAFT_67093 [Didymella exigua CBS 183.55]KAF1926666.1 hypothetical protein M421DRAFT_67093 [Didymella exigua CBS 183.55]
MPPPSSFSNISHRLLDNARLASAPTRPADPSLTAAIADLALHPTLEATCHILNHDLPSAHFLVRHMQAPPALEGMLLHSILHRSEGDFGNARLWLGDVGDACEGWVPKKRRDGERLDVDVAGRCACPSFDASLVDYVYGEQGVEGAQMLVDDVEAFRKRKGGESEEGRLNERIREEMTKGMEWCVEKFGTRRYADASKAWVKNSEEVQKISNDMVSGGKGHREF